MSISYFWLERGGGWGSSPSTSTANHQKLNVIQKLSILCFWLERVADGVQVHRPAQPTSEVEHNPKISISFFWLERCGGWDSSPLTSPTDHKLKIIQNEHFIFLAREGWQMGFKSIDQHSQSSEVEHNPKMSILIFWLERGGRWGSSPSTSPANHQK